MKNLFKKFTFQDNILFAMVVVTLLSLVVFSFTSSNLYFNSDTATSNLLANEQVFEKRFYPSDWVYAQDIWTFFLNIPIVFMSLFMNDQLVMRSIASVLFIGIAIITTVFFHRSLFQDRSWGISIPLLFSAISMAYATVVFGQTAYLPPLIYIMLSLILFTNSVNDNFKIVNKKQFLAFSVLIIFLGINGLRYIQAIGLPLLVSICVVFFIEYFNSSHEKIKKIISYLIGCLSCVFLLICGGFLAFLLTKSTVHFVPGPTLLRYTSFDQIENNFHVFSQSMLYLFGFQSGVNLFSLPGFFNGFKVITLLFTTIVFPYNLLRNYKNETFKVKIFIVFSISHVFIILFLSFFVNLLSDLSTSRYLITCIFLLFLMSSYYIYNYILNKKVIVKLVVLLGIFIFCLSSMYLLFQTSKGYQTNMNHLKSVVTFLKEKDLNYGYASYWNAGKNTVLSNFEVKVNAINITENNIKPYYWLSSYRWYRPETFTGKTFLLLTKEEKDVLFKGEVDKFLGSPQATYSINEFEVIVYDYNIAEKAWVSVMDFERALNIAPSLSYNDHVVVQEEGYFKISNGGVLYGPYLELSKGSYTLYIDIETNDLDITPLRLTAENGTVLVKTVELVNGQNEIKFDLTKNEIGIEFLISNSNTNDILVKKMNLINVLEHK